MKKERMFSVTSKDVEWKMKRGSGKGGQARNKTSNAVQCYHAPSGASGEAEDEREMPINRKKAFERMIATPEFQSWLKLKIDAGLGKVEIEEPNDLGYKVKRKLRMDEV